MKKDLQQRCRDIGLTPSRSLGQNFLVQAWAVDRLLEAAELTEQDLVIEIGAGAGHITRRLALEAGRLQAIEIDERLKPLQDTYLHDLDQVTLHLTDARQVALQDLAADWQGTVVGVANLPYYITTELVEQMLCQLPQARRLLFLMQEEAADRFLSPPGSKGYGPTSVLLALHGSTSRVLTLSPDAFWLRPSVSSALVQVDRQKDRPDWASDPQGRLAFRRFLGRCFHQRRKQLKNNLSDIPKDQLVQAFETLGLSDTVRAEALNPQAFFSLFEALA